MVVVGNQGTVVGAFVGSRGIVADLASAWLGSCLECQALNCQGSSLQGSDCGQAGEVSLGMGDDLGSGMAQPWHREAGCRMV
jgi:hypothetical protein